MGKKSEELTRQIEALPAERAAQILATLAAAHPPGRPVVLDGELRQAIAELLAGDGDRAPAFGHDEIARQALHLLAREPQRADELHALTSTPAAFRAGTDPVTATALVTAVILVLQTHIDFSRSKDGRWSLKVSKKALSATPLGHIVRRLLASLIEK